MALPAVAVIIPAVVAKDRAVPPLQRVEALLEGREAPFAVATLLAHRGLLVISRGVFVHNSVRVEPNHNARRQRRAESVHRLAVGAVVGREGNLGREPPQLLHLLIVEGCGAVKVAPRALINRAADGGKPREEKAEAV